MAAFAASGAPRSVDQVVQLKVALKHTRPPIWRRVLLPATATFNGDSPVEYWEEERHGPVLTGVIQDVGNICSVVHDQQERWRLVGVTQIDIDDDALERAMTLSGAKTKKEAVNLALQFYADKQERAARIARHFERAQHWQALDDAERLHQAEKEIR